MVMIVWSYGRWIYNYLCNQYLSPLTLWVRTPLRWGVLDIPASSFNKSDRHDITDICLRMTLNMINQTKPTLNHHTGSPKIHLHLMDFLEQRKITLAEIW